MESRLSLGLCGHGLGKEVREGLDDREWDQEGANHQWPVWQIRKPQSKSRRRKRVVGTSQSAIVQVGKPRH